jgi:hypothetical protein
VAPSQVQQTASAGPTIVVSCHNEELSATAVPKCSRGTRFGSIAWLAGMANARATPNNVMTPKTGRALSRPR